jgi:Na+/melibiose symporter-like transporter
LTVGYALVFVGYDAGNEKMSPEALTRLRLFIALVPSVCLLAAMAVFVPYSLSRDRLREIQEALRLRRAARYGESGQ